ncbi:hypothetical protein ACFL5G_03655 [Candidatus Margulisiibacteriota bacterium]
MWKWLLKLRDKLALWLYRRECKKFMKQKYGIDMQKKKKKQKVNQDLEFYNWIASKEYRRETDMEYFLIFTEQLLKMIVDGELTQEDLEEMLQSANPLREKRIARLVDEELQEVIRGGKGKVPEETVVIQEKSKESSAMNKDMLKRSLLFVQDIFQPNDKSSIMVDDRVKIAQKKQWELEQKRLEAYKKAVLANSPEFLEMLGKDEYESEAKQAARENKIVRKEEQKLRARMVKDTIPIKRPREKTPKELAAEKLRIIRKMREEMGRGLTLST